MIGGTEHGAPRDCSAVSSREGVTAAEVARGAQGWVGWVPPPPPPADKPSSATHTHTYTYDLLVNGTHASGTYIQPARRHEKHTYVPCRTAGASPHLSYRRLNSR